MDLPGWRVVRDFTRNAVSAWPQRAFELPIYKRRIFGITGVLVNDPEGTRHVLSTNVTNYVQTIPFIRMFRPLMGNGLLLATGETWRAQRRILAPALTPASVGRLLPHFRIAAETFVDSLAGRQEINLSSAFQHAAIDAALRALFTLPDPVRRQRLARGRGLPRRTGRAQSVRCLRALRAQLAASAAPPNGLCQSVVRRHR